MHVQVKVIRCFRQVECRIFRHNTIHTDVSAHLYQRQYGIDYYIESYGVNHCIVRAVGGCYKFRCADFGRCISIVGSHTAGNFQFGRKHINNINLPQAEEFAQLYEAQSYRTGTYYNHFLSRSQVEILESSQYFTPGTGNYRFFRLHMRRNRILNFKAVPASLFGCGKSFFLQHFEVIHYYIFAETAPAAINALRAKVGNEAADRTIAYFKVANLLACRYYDSGILMSQSQRICIYAGKMSGNQFTVGSVTQCHHFCFYQCLICIDCRCFHLSYFNFAGSRHNHSFHCILIRLYNL